MAGPDLLRNFRERVVQRRGARLRVFERGEGPPLLLVHGSGGSAWNFDELASRLPDRRLIVPDLPGHGGSSPLPAAPSLAGFADALAPLLGEPTDVLGHSLGGVVALRLAERPPALVRRGVLRPARIAGRRVDRLTRSPGLRRLVFQPFEVANAEVLSEAGSPRLPARL